MPARRREALQEGSTSTTYRRIRQLFREVFDNDEMEISDDTSAKDVPGWDSLAQVKLVIGLEEEFGIKFTTHEVAQMSCVGDLRKTLACKGIPL
jgi:acyl carrier protein